MYKKLLSTIACIMFICVLCTCAVEGEDEYWLNDRLDHIESELDEFENYEQEEDYVHSKVDLDVNIDNNLFSDTSIRLNTEIYEVAANVINDAHLFKCYSQVNTKLLNSYRSYINPLMPIAETTCETGMWADKRYTWSPAIYSKLLLEKEVDLDTLNVAEVTTNTYIVNGLTKVLGCGNNCTNALDVHEHFDGLNDNDSLGPMQILRRYVEQNGGYIRWRCGETTYDLMSWADNVQYFFHTESDYFAIPDHWKKDYTIQSENELMALIACGHATGGSFHRQSGYDGNGGSYWLNAGSVFDFCAKLGSPEVESILQEFVDEHYDHIVELAKEGNSFSLAGDYPWNSDTIAELLDECDIDVLDYATQIGHKQIYPVKVVLNYMTLKKLYTSGNLEDVVDEVD